MDIDEVHFQVALTGNTLVFPNRETCCQSRAAGGTCCANISCIVPTINSYFPTGNPRIIIIRIDNNNIHASLSSLHFEEMQ